MLTGIAACVFDAYGTLLDVRSATGRLAGEMGDKADQVGAVWRTRQLEYTWLLSLMGEHRDFWQVTGDALDYALDASGLDDPGLKHRLMERYLSLDCYPDVAPVLAELRLAGLKTAILSNGTPEMLAAGIESAGITDSLDAVLSVEEVGVYKPHPSVYQLACERLGMARERICFVSSNGWDVAGAAHFGFQTVWLNRLDQTRDRLPGPPKLVMRSLDRLPGLVARGDA
ncbi:haloacid dehalogenase type II [Skermanella mucosa]|uniref:haloacid dehalogenase type II n=1 Tax=Skermanella mucosa TaxID=1789672 RepID=UPI00192B6569|nr:haloacid dehalogenase type II [Skermanella mucosa]UEM23334.1 haloacid dehalogenase type II [Skermanella mucosa]